MVGVNWSEPPSDDGVGARRLPGQQQQDRYATTALGPQFDAAESAIGRLKGALSDLVTEATKATKKITESAKSMGGGVGGRMAAGASYTGGHITGAAAAMRSRYQNLYTDPSGHVDEAARVQLGLQTGQIVGQVGGGINRYFGAMTGRASGLDWAATQRTQLYGGGYGEGRRENFNRWQSGYGNVHGWQNLEDLSRGSLINNRMGGSQRSLQQMGNLAALNPMMGLAGAGAGMSQMLSSQAMNFAAPFGGGAVARGGRRRSADEMLTQYAFMGSGRTHFGGGRGGLTQRGAREVFSEGSQGRQNLRSAGLSDEMIDTVMQYSAQSGAAGRALDLDSKTDQKRFNGAFLSNVNKRSQKGGERDVRVFEDSRDAQENWNDLMGSGAKALGEFVDKLGAANALLAEGKGGLIVGSLGQTGILGMMLAQGGGGGGLGGLGGLSARAASGGMGGNLAAGGLMAMGGAAGFAAGSVVDSMIPKHSKWQRAAGGAAKWGATGAGIGAMMGGGVFSAPGAAIGGLAGAALGGIGGFFGVGDPETNAGATGPLPPGPSDGAYAPSLDKALRRMFQDNPKLQVSSGRRTVEHQRQLFLGRHYVDPKGKYVYEGKRWSRRKGQPPTAVPGTSKHERGLAVDIGPSSEYSWLAANAAKYGLKRTVANEPWHFEPINSNDGAQASTGGSVIEQELTPGGFSPGAISHGGLSGGGMSLGGASANQAGEFGAAGVASSAGSVGGTGAGNGGGNGDLLSILRNAGFEGEGLRMAYAVSMAESRGRAGAHNTNAGTGDNSYGLFQINMLGKMGPARRKQFGLSSNDALLDPTTNARVAFQMSGGGKSWGAWSTYKRGEHQKFYDANIGDPETPSSTAVRMGSSISASKTVHVGQVNITVKTETVSYEEARRLVTMMKDVLSDDDNLTRTGAH